MSDKTEIEWADATWNPLTGCTKVSPGCDHCYAETFAERWRGTPGHYFENGFDVQLRPDKLTVPLRWRKPRKVFVNSMSDLFHDKVPDEYIARVFAVMALASQHTFQLLTKRHGRMRSLLSDRWFSETLLPEVVDEMAPKSMDEWGFRYPLPNLWLGVSVEDQKWADTRVPALLRTPAAVRWLSCEPLLGPVHLTDHWLYGDTGGAMVHGGTVVDWVVVGGESGPGARPMHPDWARSLRDQCTGMDVPFLFKQQGQWTWLPQLDSPGGFVGPLGEWRRDLPRAARLDRWYPMWRVGKGRAGRMLDGRTWDEYPAVAL